MVFTDFKDRFQDYVFSRNISYRRVARDAGYSTTVISQYINGVYNGDIEKLESALQKWFNDEKRRLNVIEIDYVPIKSTQRILKALSLVHQEKSIAVIVGHAGVGKSYAIQHYQANPHVIVIQGEPGMNTNDIIRRMAEAVNMVGNSIARLKRNIVSYLGTRDAIIIVDEANYLHPEMLEIARRVFHDQGGAALAFFGVKTLMSNVFVNPRDFDQLQRRVGAYLDLSRYKMTFKEAKAIAATVTDSLSDEAIKIMVNDAGHNPGKYVMLLKRVLKTVALKAEEVTPEVVKQCEENILCFTNLRRRN